MKLLLSLLLFTGLLSAENTASNVDLTANEVFFSPVGTLSNVSIGTGSSDLNQGYDFGYTKSWKNKTDTLVWAVDIPTIGELTITPYLGVPSSQAGSEIEIMVDNQKKTFSLVSTGSYTSFVEQTALNFTIAKAGRYTIKMKINSAKSTAEVAYVQKLSLSGTASVDLEPVLLRWRPIAAHANFSNTSNPSNITLAIHEVTIKSTFIDSYSPITSPFGYFGSTWSSKSQSFGGVNFSLWSFKKDATPPPTEQFSHLIAVGKGLYIDGFNHEGTGCKARGDNPFDKMVGISTQVLGLKKVPGNPYDVYYSYYWEPTEKKWYLYGCGKKYNTASYSYLTTGTFLEVPGTAKVQRSNHVTRDVRHRAWLMDKKNEWYPVDKMTTPDNTSDISYRNLGIDEDKYFYLHAGGIDTLPTTITKTYTITDYPTEIPEYLAPEKLSDLTKLPATISIAPITNISHNSATINFNIDDAGTKASAKLYWGKSDGLTYVEGNKGNGGVVSWDENSAVQIEDGKVSHTITNLDPETNYYFRLQIKNDEGETWSWDTKSFTTTKDYTSIESATQNNIKIISSKGKMQISNYNNGDLITVIDSTGKKYHEMIANSDKETISLKSGAYIVNIGPYSKKVIVK